MSKVLAAHEAAKNSTLATDAGKAAPVPKKKLKKSNADKGIIISDNPSGPPLDDVSFLRLPLLLLFL